MTQNQEFILIWGGKKKHEKGNHQISKCGVGWGQGSHACTQERTGREETSILLHWCCTKFCVPAVWLSPAPTSSDATLPACIQGPKHKPFSEARGKEYDCAGGGWQGNAESVCSACRDPGSLGWSAGCTDCAQLHPWQGLCQQQALKGRAFIFAHLCVFTLLFHFVSWVISSQRMGNLSAQRQNWVWVTFLCGPWSLWLH